MWNREGVALSSEIPPTFWQSWPFKLLIALAAMALLWLAYSLRLRAVAARIRDRMAERLGERERISRELHDMLLQSVQALILRFQFAADDLPRGAPARAALEEALDQADRVVEEGRGRVHALRLPGGDSAIETVLRDLAARQGFGPESIST